MAKSNHSNVTSIWEQFLRSYVHQSNWCFIKIKHQVYMVQFPTPDKFYMYVIQLLENKTQWRYVQVEIESWSKLLAYHISFITCWLCLSVSCLSSSSMFTECALVSKLPSLVVTNVQKEPLLSPNLSKLIMIKSLLE